MLNQQYETRNKILSDLFAFGPWIIDLQVIAVPIIFYCSSSFCGWVYNCLHMYDGINSEDIDGVSRFDFLLKKRTRNINAFVYGSTAVGLVLGVYLRSLYLEILK